MSQYSVKQAKEEVVLFDIPQTDQHMNCKSRDAIKQGRMLTMKLTEALNNLPPRFREALAGGDFYSEDGIAALRALRQVSDKKAPN